MKKEFFLNQNIDVNSEIDEQRDEEIIADVISQNYIAVKRGSSVRAAMRELVKSAGENDNISIIYVLDEDGKLYGTIELKALILAREGDDLEKIIDKDFQYVYAHEEISLSLDKLTQCEDSCMPVLDENGRLVGIIPAQDISKLIDTEMGEDYAMLGGLTGEEDLMEPTVKSIGKRLPWLMALLGLGLLVSSVVGLFEKTVAALPIIICFQSLVLDMAGNVGTQSLAVTIRSISERQLTKREKAHLIFKESKIGILNGLCLGAISLAVVFFYLTVLKDQTAILALRLSGATSIALAASMLLSALAGTVIPLLLAKLKVDPAVASGPLITTINDLVAVVVYYTLAILLVLRVSV